MITITQAKVSEGKKIVEFEMRVWEDKEVVSRYEAVNLARFGSGDGSVWWKLKYSNR